MEGSRPCAGPQNERGKLLLEFMENFTPFATNIDCQCTALVLMMGGINQLLILSFFPNLSLI